MLALEARLRYTGAPVAALLRRMIPMTETAPPGAQQPDPPNKPSSAMGYVWIIAGIAGIALLLALSLFIGGLGEYR